MYQKPKIIFNKHHAQLPTILPLSDRLRIFYSTKKDNISIIRAFDVNPDDPSEIIAEDKLILDVGERGKFDDSGVMPSCVVAKDGFYVLYYTGWYRRETVPYGHMIGIALSRNGLDFERIGIALGISVHDPYLVNSGVVVDERTMLYCSGNGWDENFPKYHIAKATMENNRWVPHNEVVVGEPDEAVSRVAFFENKIWFAAKKKNSSYNIEYLEGMERRLFMKDACYPAFYKNHLFYNYKDYGATGIWWTCKK